MDKEETWFDQGIALFDEGNYQDAINAFNKAITMNQSLTDAWCNRGLAYARLGDYPHAIQSFDKTLALDPGHENAVKARGMVIRLMGDAGNAFPVPGAVATQASPGIAPAVPAYVPPGIAGFSEKEEIRSPLLAAVFSFFFPGWGQWYDGKRWDGLKFLGASIGLNIFALISAYVLKSSPAAFALVFVLFLFAAFGVWFYGMYDAYRTADAINRGEVAFARKSRLFWLPVVMVALMVVMLILAVVLAAFIFAMVAGTAHGGTTATAYSGGASAIQHVKVIAVTAEQTDASHILVVYQGGQDADQLSQIAVMVTDSTGATQMSTIGQASDPEVNVGSSATLTGAYSGKDHVVAIGRFRDGTTQLILDNYV